MELGEIAVLLPYHSHVDPAAVAAGLNRLIDDAGANNVFELRLSGAPSADAPDLTARARNILQRVADAQVTREAAG